MIFCMPIQVHTAQQRYNLHIYAVRLYHFKYGTVPWHSPVQSALQSRTHPQYKIVSSYRRIFTQIFHLCFFTFFPVQGQDGILFTHRRIKAIR